MVDVLRAAHEALRHAGWLVDLQPHAHYQPRVTVVDSRARVDLGDIVREPDADVLAGHAARDRAVAEGLFRTVRVADRTYRARYTSVAAFDAELAANSNWSLPRGWRPQLERAWQRRHDEAAILVAKRFTVAILRKV